MVAAALIAFAQDPDSVEGRKQLFVWCAILAGIVVLGYVVVLLVRSRVNSTDSTAGAQGFSLSDLRAMHKAGEISTEEFEQTKARMFSAAKRMVESVPAIKPKKLPGIVPDAGPIRPDPPADESPGPDVET